MTVRAQTTRQRRLTPQRFAAGAATAVLVTTFILAPNQFAAADDAPAVDAPAQQPAEAEPEPTPEPTPTPTAVPTAAPTTDPSAEPPVDPPTTAALVDDPETGAAAPPATAPLLVPAAARVTPAAAMPPAAAAPVALAAFDPNAFSITVTPTTVAPGEDFTIEVSGCPFDSGTGTPLQIPAMNPVVRPDLTTISSGDNVLGGLSSGSFSVSTDDPWTQTYTVSATAPLGDYRIHPKCQTRENDTDPFTIESGSPATLTVQAAAPVVPTATVSPASGYPGDQFTTSIIGCPDQLGPNGIAITQGGGHTGPTPYLDAFDFVQATHVGEPKLRTLEVTDEAEPGVYTVLLKCYAEAGQPAVSMEPVTFTVLSRTPSPTPTPTTPTSVPTTPAPDPAGTGAGAGGDSDDAPSAASDVVDEAVDSSALATSDALPDTGSNASPQTAWAALLAVLLGILIVAANRRRA